MIARSTLSDFWKRHPDSRGPLIAWYRQAEKADWDTPSKVRATHGNASFVGADRVVFRIKGTKYRLVVRLEYQQGLVYVRFVGTHAQYDRINAKEI